jgi:DNA-binding response OmpR family regulator
VVRDYKSLIKSIKNQGMSQKDIIVVDDDVEDFLILKDAFAENHYEGQIISCRSGDELFMTLSDSDKLPSLIVLDISLPVKDGFEILYDIKLDARLRKIPLIILSMHSNQVNMDKAYDLGANCYIKKPMDYTEMIHITKCIISLWLKKEAVKV